ncbi:MAG: hypothetical protein CVV49_14385 [Spirochaetae bacterium HGW-Spirochaetae-5]|nr:MAG: hypothetical protein CVV49_14385 [Spirochaetae bacterium HGW-Spirochaetae-5]
MLNLAVHLNRNNNFSALIFLTQNQHPLEEKFNGLITTSIAADTDLIIKDMRDSTIEEMNSLRRIAPVLAIDDSGMGRDFADYAVNLLPVPSVNGSAVKPETSLFIYGYNFTEGISLLKSNSSFTKDIDVTVYAGYNPAPKLISSIRESIKGNFLKTETPYAEIISRSKIVITHFGLTMFEADACGCKIAALNPTEYHSKLTEIASDDFNIIYSAEYNSLSPEILKKKIETELKKNTETIISPEEILKKINNGTENFIRYINSICND